jgi:hypothetical protein
MLHYTTRNVNEEATDVMGPPNARLQPRRWWIGDRTDWRAEIRFLKNAQVRGRASGVVLQGVVGPYSWEMR